MKEQKKAILIEVLPPETTAEEAEIRLNESEALINTYGGIVVLKVIQQRNLPEYSTYIGSGKIKELQDIVIETGATSIIINNILKPRQIFNLQEKFRELKLENELDIWDRVDLILKIFDKHAKSTEAKLQIELASIKHMGPRIFNMGMELSRQAGAVGLRSGQGESNTEMMKRHLQRQEINISDKLKHYQNIRGGHRQRRRRQDLKTVALVGYTNAGKSSLLNALTNKGAYVADQLFATLDTRVGKLYLQNEIQDYTDYKYQKGGSEILIADTIGFIRDLPPFLIESFKSTLAETIEADLIMHVIDINDPQIEAKIEVVETILTQLGIGDTPEIYVFNKVDLINPTALEEKILDPVIEYQGLVPAGPTAALDLGWISEEEYNRKHALPMPKIHPQDLKDKYSHHKPVFISANEQKNLEDLKKIIKIRLGLN